MSMPCCPGPQDSVREGFRNGLLPTDLVFEGKPGMIGDHYEQRIDVTFTLNGSNILEFKLATNRWDEFLWDVSLQCVFMVPDHGFEAWLQTCARAHAWVESLKKLGVRTLDL